MKARKILLSAGATLALICASLPALAGALQIAGGVPGVAQFENQAAGGLGFPCDASGCTPLGPAPGSSSGDANHPSATLQALDAGTYRFTYYGAGDAANSNTFSFSTLTPIANNGSQIPFNQSGFWQQSLDLAAGTFITFTLASVLPTGAPDCSISEGGLPTGDCSYLLAYDPADPNSVFVGFSDTEAYNGDCTDPQGAACPDYQDLVVKVSYVPEPITLSVFGAGLAGAAALRRRRTTVRATRQ